MFVTLIIKNISGFVYLTNFLIKSSLFFVLFFLTPFYSVCKTSLLLLLLLLLLLSLLSIITIIIAFAIEKLTLSSLRPLLLLFLLFLFLLILLYLFVIIFYFHCCDGYQFNITITVSIISFLNI